MKLIKIIFPLILFFLFHLKAYANYEIDARYVILQDHHSGEILYEKDADTQSNTFRATRYAKRPR